MSIIRNVCFMGKYFVVVGISTYVTKIPKVVSSQALPCTTNFLNKILLSSGLRNHLNALIF